MTAFFRARVTFLTTAEGGRTDAIRFRSLDDDSYAALLDFGFGETDEGHPIRALAHLAPDGPGSLVVEPGGAYDLRPGSTVRERYVVPGAGFAVSEGPRIAARGAVVSRSDDDRAS